MIFINSLLCTFKSSSGHHYILLTIHSCENLFPNSFEPQRPIQSAIVDCHRKHKSKQVLLISA